jgi:hypothetical protein
MFKGYRDPETKRKTVLQDNKGQKWYRASNQVRKYYPRSDFTKLYMDRIKEIDDREPMGKEIEMRFVEETYNAPSFVTDWGEVNKDKKGGGFPSGCKDSLV